MQDFTHIFEGVDDPRRGNATRHDLTDMLMIALLGMICGAENCSDMARFGRAREDLLRKFLSLKHGIPGHDAFPDLFAILDPAGVNRALSRLAGDWADTLEGTVAAIDGKTPRRSFSDAAARSPLHLVQAFAVGAKRVPGQVRVDARSNEITAIPALPDLLDIEGATVTADAMRTRRSTSEAIIARGGDHVPALKGNQETLNDDVRLFMEDPGMAEHIGESREIVEKDRRKGPRPHRNPQGAGPHRRRLASRGAGARLARPGRHWIGRGPPGDPRQAGAGDATLHHERGDDAGAVHERRAGALGH